MSAFILPAIPKAFPLYVFYNQLILFGYFTKWERGSITLNFIRARIILQHFFVRVNICILIPIFPKMIKSYGIIGGCVSGLLLKGVGMAGRIK